jgi:hypothetical protein
MEDPKIKWMRTGGSPMTKRKRENNAFIQKRLEKMQQEFVDLSLLNLPKNS